MKLLSLLPYFVLALNIEAHPYSNGGDSGQYIMNKPYTSNTSKAFTSHTSWNLARLCQPAALTENEGMSDTTKNWPGCLKPNLGSGVLVYVIDNGVDGAHAAFGNRVEPGRHVFDANQKGNTETVDPKNNFPSHGTQVAAVIAGEGVGVAPAATIIPFNMYDIEKKHATEEGLWVGVRLIAQDFKTRREKNAEVQAVINISAESANDAGNALAIAIGEALELGMHVVISAGNEDKDMCSEWVSTHHAARDVITVGGTNIQDDRLFFLATPPQRSVGSNYGECVDLYAPGQNVNTVATTQNTDEWVHGTSFSAPLVSGIIAAILSQGERLTPPEMKKRILQLATVIRIPNLPRGQQKQQPIAQFDPKIKI